MIAYLKGTLQNKINNKLIINCSGVGYLVSVLPTQVAKYHEGEEIELYIYTHVKEDILALFGFSKIQDLRTFEQLITVSGIGPKIALSIMTSGTSDDITSAIKEGKVEFFTKVPGIGKKNAQRLIVELRSKVGGDLHDLSYLSQENLEVLSALENLGFTKKEAAPIAKAADTSLPIEEQIKWSLRQLSNKK